jgi:hypothetical protein
MAGASALVKALQYVIEDDLSVKTIQEFGAEI